MLMRFFCVLLLILLSHQTEAKAELKRNLTIMADPSLTVVVSLIAREYALKHDVAITTIFSATPAQIKQIEEGDESDVIISARPEWIDAMQQKGLIDVFSRRNIARNNLVLAGTQFNLQRPNMKLAKDIAAFSKAPDRFMLVMGDLATTAEGNYAMQALENYKLNQMLEPHYTFVTSPDEVANMIERYDAMGIMFRTDVQLFRQIKEIEAFDAEAHNPLIYQAAAVVGENMELAREFILYLNKKHPRNVFREYGFSTFF